MADLKRSEIRAIENAMAFPRGFGYVLDFSDRTFGEYFQDEFGVEIYTEQFSTCGTSKRNRLLSYLQQADNSSVLRVLRSLWELREGLLSEHEGLLGSQDAAKNSESFRKVIDRLQSEPDSVSTDGIQTFAPDRTLEELVANIERLLAANKPEVAIDHLHTYCMKRFAHLLKVRGVDFGEDEPLHSKFGKYRKQLVLERPLHEFTDRALKSFISLLESLNDIRNNHSLAHDNKILETFEARFIFSSISAMLVMIRTLEAGRYES
ncbi:abortive infection family protein [uncultured Halomonas sp.]|uniref:abortive infection family protein n=1 Tax=uncultured Halomonas sp. TaxID=173971 RepID=UPI00261C23A4|nr:abortive infection family protein [uncultured Halomonas sp.]